MARQVRPRGRAGRALPPGLCWTAAGSAVPARRPCSLVATLWCLSPARRSRLLPAVHAQPWPTCCRYARHREPLVAALLLAHAALLRAASLPSLLRLLPPGAAANLPWLLRATGTEALAIFPLGFKASAGRCRGACRGWPASLQRPGRTLATAAAVLGAPVPYWHRACVLAYEQRGASAACALPRFPAASLTSLTRAEPPLLLASHAGMKTCKLMPSPRFPACCSCGSGCSSRCTRCAWRLWARFGCYRPTAAAMARPRVCAACGDPSGHVVLGVMRKGGPLC